VGRHGCASAGRVVEVDGPLVVIDAGVPVVLGFDAGR
jgi:hypothetical protein